jgi:hypothetical protein
MPISLTCPSCGKKLRAPDHSAGGRARCPQCQTVLTLPAVNAQHEEALDAEPVKAAVGLPPTPPPPYNAETRAAPRSEAKAQAGNAVLPVAEAAVAQAAVDVPRQPCPNCGEMIPVGAQQCRFCRTIFDTELRASRETVVHPGWKSVRNGLRTVYISLITIFLGAIVIGISVASAFFMSRGSDNALAFGASIVMVIILAIVIIVASIAMVVGQFMCCAAPAASGAKAFAMIAAFSIIGNMVFSGASEAMKGSDFERVLDGLAGLTTLVGNICFVLFIRKIAKHLGDEELASSAARFLIFMLVVVAGLVGGAVASAVAKMEPLLAVLGICAFVLLIVGFLWYLRLLRSAVKTIDSYRARGGNVTFGFPVLTQ